MDYLSDRVDLGFAFANANSRPIYRHWGFTELGRVTARFRIQNPKAIFPADRAWRLPVAAAVSLTGRAHLAVRDRGISSPPANVSVTRMNEVPAGRLSALYRRNVPERLHVVRDAEYYRWRLGAPGWPGDVYVATKDDVDAAAFLTRSRAVTDEITRLEVSEVLPLVPDSESTPGFSALLDRIVRDNPSADVISIRPSIVPEGVLRRWGFVSNARPPLSWLCARVYVNLWHFVHPYTDLDVDVTSPDTWLVSELTVNSD